MGRSESVSWRNTIKCHERGIKKQPVSTHSRFRRATPKTPPQKPKVDKVIAPTGKSEPGSRQPSAPTSPLESISEEMAFLPGKQPEETSSCGIPAPDPEGALQRLFSGGFAQGQDVRQCPQISVTALALDASFCQPSAF